APADRAGEREPTSRKAAASGFGVDERSAGRATAARGRRVSPVGSGRTNQTRPDHQAGNPLCDNEQLSGHGFLFSGSRVHAAAGGGSGGARESQIKSAGLWFVGARRLPAVVRDESFLGRDAG